MTICASLNIIFCILAKNHNSEKISFQRVTDTNSLDISNKPLSKPTIKSVEESMGYSEISMNLPKHKTGLILSHN